MQPPAVGVEVGHDLKGHDFCVESCGILLVIVPNLINDIAEELGDTTFGCLIAGLVVEVGFVGGLGTNSDNGCGIISNVLVIEGEAGRPDELGAAGVSFVLGGLRSYGMTMRRGRRVSLMASRSLLVGFPLRGGKVS
jgi:hypothetical protein